MSFQMRTSKPAAGNKFFITTAKGGYSYCIQGSPTDGACNVLSNCVGYACGRFNEIIGSMKYPALNCNAENFIERAQSLGLEITQTPSLGAIMVWQKGTLASSDGAGHVEVVERIDSDTQVYTSASNYAGTAFYNATRKKSGGNWNCWTGYTFRGFIKNPAVTVDSPAADDAADDPVVETADGKISVGATVNFTGGKVYASSTAQAAAATKGESVCKVTATAYNAAHPYHCVSQDGKGVYGWVDFAAVGGATASSTAAAIHVGSTVRLKSGAKTYTGGRLISAAYNRNHIVKEIKGERVVITYGGVVVAAVKLADLTLVTA